MTDGETFGDRLRWVRERWGMSQVELGKASRLGTRLIEIAEADEIDPESDALGRLAETLMVAEGWLAYGTEPMLFEEHMTPGELNKHRPWNSSRPGLIEIFNGVWYRDADGELQVTRDGEAR